MSKRRSSPALFELLSEPRPDSAPLAESPNPPAPLKPTAQPDQPKAETPPRDPAAAEPVKPKPSVSEPPAKPIAEKPTPPRTDPKAASTTTTEPKPAQPKPAVTPVTPVTESAPAQARPTPAPSSDPEPTTQGQMPKTIRINPLTISYVVTWSLFILVIGWVLGFQSGQNESDRAWEAANAIPTFADTGEVPFDPLLLDEERSLEPEPPRRQESASSMASDSQTAGGGSSQTTPSDAERRTPGLNYLALGVISQQEEADRLVRFLSSEGLPAQMVRVRTRGSTGWQVLTLQGITGREYGRDAPVKRDHEARVSELGQKWRNELRGTLDFTVPERRQWTKYDP